MVIKHIKATNFCGCKSLDTELYKNTLITGKNAVGKSTIKSMVFWVLFDKLADGSGADGIRPHDEAGNDINYINIEVELTTEIEGREVIFKKTQIQNWVKDRTTQENVFKGNENQFEINGIPKKKADYEEYIKSNVMPLDKLMLCINPFIFLNLDTKKRRAKLFEMVEDFSDEDVIKTDKDFEDIRNDLKDGTIDELILRSRKVINAKKHDLDLIPARIDELDKQIHYEDVAEWELAKTDCKNKIAANLKKQKFYEAQIEDHKNLEVELLGMEMELNEIVRKSNQDLIAKKTNLMSMKAQLESNISNAERTITNLNTTISEAKADVNACDVIIANKREEYSQIKATTFDENSTVCSFCGQPLPKEQVDKLISKFEEEKKAKLEAITEVGNANSELIKHRTETIKACETQLGNIEEDIKGFKDNLNKVEAEYESLADEIDLNTVPEYVDQKQKIEDKKKILDKSEAKELNAQLIDEYQKLIEEMADIDKKLSVNDFNVGLENRIEELNEERIEISQMIMNQEKKLDVYSRFQRAKVDMITDKINSYFDVIKFRLFKQLINGNFEECCEPIYNGTSYDKTLNHGAKILCETDICRAFQKANKVSMPIMIDDSESVDSDKIPKLDSQVISIRRTDDEVLTIKEF